MEIYNQFFPPIILGLVQGLGEFLPISSSGHLVLVPWLFEFRDPGLAFDVALHAGTLIAVVAYFWRDWLEIFSAAFKRSDNNQPKEKISKRKDYNEKTLWLLVIATIPGVIAGLFLEKQAATIFRNPLLVAFNLFMMGAILYVVDRYSKRNRDIKTIGYGEAFLIGLSQAFAIIPGVSRAGATITAALAMGINREAAARFSFLMATPIIFGATVMELPEFFKHGIDMSIVIGTTVAAVIGYLAIKYLLKLIQEFGYQIFFWYRLVLAIVIIIFYMARN
jgi:undecaprenyl-diphosphatase